ncbi:putative amino acid kinase [Raoultella terrigena]|uniref:Putative amino acid kinase n=1 Tax=Raoultella terrigena TaxID=577 RepID=A0A4U9CUP4_RAOTE|nr:putative amino acid kinase [Raoultella terrigena]
MLIILTAVEKVAINFGQANQQWLDRLSLSDARPLYCRRPFRQRLHAAESRGRRGVLPRSRPGRRALITMLSKAREGIEGKREP